LHAKHSKKGKRTKTGKGTSPDDKPGTGSTTTTIDGTKKNDSDSTGRKQFIKGNPTSNLRKKTGASATLLPTNEKKAAKKKKKQEKNKKKPTRSQATAQYED